MDAGEGFTNLRPGCEIIERCSDFGWSNASCPKQHRKKAMISIQTSAESQFFGLNKFSRTNAHISKLPLHE